MALLQTPEAERILAEAKEQEREHNWLGAADSYKSVLDLFLGQEVKSAETIERLGYALYRTARQADTAEEFRARIGQSMMRYEEGRDLYEKLGSVGRKLRCDAMLAHLGFWLTAKPAERKKLSTEAWRLTRQALEAFGQGTYLYQGSSFACAMKHQPSEYFSRLVRPGRLSPRVLQGSDKTGERFQLSV